MQDKDLTNLPILDDIIVPGDAGKAAKDKHDALGDATWEQDEDGTIDLSSSDITARIDTGIPDGTQVVVGEDRSNNPADPDIPARPVDAAELVIDELTSPATAARAAVRSADTAQPLVAAASQADIDTLTDIILARMMPDLEDLMRETIRQALQQHLPDEIDRD